MGGISSRNKGKRAEREIIAYLQPVVNEVYCGLGMTPPELERNLLQSHKGGHDLLGLDWMAPEVKFQEQLNVSAWWRQTVAQAVRCGGEPVLFFKQSRKPWTIRMKGRLNAGSCSVVHPVDIPMDVFLEWFRLKLKYILELSRTQDQKSSGGQGG